MQNKMNEQIGKFREDTAEGLVFSKYKSQSSQES